MRKFFTALMAIAMLLIPSAAFAAPSENANCVGKARAAEQGTGDKELARAFAKAMGQEGNGVGAFVVFVSNLEGDACPAA